MLLIITSFVPAGRSADEILRDCALRSGGLARLRVSLDLADRVRRNRDGRFISTNQEILAHFDTGDRTTFEISDVKEDGGEPGPPPRKSSSRILCDNKVIYRFGDSDGKPFVVVSPKNLPQWAVDPRYLLCIGEWCPSKFLVETSSVVVEGPRDIGGHACLGLSWDSSRTNPASPQSSRGTYWVAPALGYAVVRVTRDYKPNADADWKAISQIEAEDFTRTGDHWLPRRVRYETHTYYDSDAHYELSKSTQATFREASTEFRPEEARVSVVIPDGTAVFDQVRKVSYFKGKLKEGEIQDQVARANALLKERLEREEAESLRRRYMRVATALGGAGAVAVVAVLLTRRFRS